MTIFLMSAFLPSFSFFGEGEYFVAGTVAFAGDRGGAPPFVPFWALEAFVVTG
jgi:hypothetical protein